MTVPLSAEIESNRYGRRRRMSKGAWALAIVLHILVFAVLIFQKSPVIVQMADHGLNAFMLPAKNDGADQTKSEQRKKQEQPRKQIQAETLPPPPATTPPPPEVPAPSNLKMPFLEISRADFAASDISKMARQSRAASGDVADSRPTYGPGAGPGGVTLYPADWYREPTSTELNTYIPPYAPRSGWGQIACKTVERYHVDDCYILGESPRGSGLGRAVLNAAWQFLVLPPRRNGQAQVGTWVSIRITYTQQEGFSAGGG